MQDKDILNQMENKSQNEQIPDSPLSKLTEENLEATLRGCPYIELVEPHNKNFDVESQRKKLENVEPEEFNYLFDEDSENYHSSIKNVDDNSSLEKLDLILDISSIYQNKEKDIRLLSRKTVRKESNDSEK